MLTRLQLKNWRSLRDVSIDFTPITVLIGANSSGKTNILDALHFTRFAKKNGPREAVFAWQGKDKIQTFGVDDPVDVDLSFNFAGKEFWQKISLFKDSNNPYLVEESPHKLAGDITYYILERWQLLRENLVPTLSMRNDFPVTDDLNFYEVDALARNVPFILSFMQESYPEIFGNLQNDLNVLLDHFNSLQVYRDEREIRIQVYEKAHPNKEASSISGGTARLIAMLTAYYALDMRHIDQPGLVVIEEPDTAIHPLLLGNFVDLLRGYTEREQPRQFILTTHNPQMLNYFEPEEVRVVERDSETGETWVDPVPDHLRETWLTEHRLGEAWTSRIIGGIPE